MRTAARVMCRSGTSALILGDCSRSMSIRAPFGGPDERLAKWVLESHHLTHSESLRSSFCNQVNSVQGLSSQLSSRLLEQLTSTIGDSCLPDLRAVPAFGRATVCTTLSRGIVDAVSTLVSRTASFIRACEATSQYGTVRWVEL